jgi:K+-sensing histidine kinase KdpD
MVRRSNVVTVLRPVIRRNKDWPWLEWLWGPLVTMLSTLVCHAIRDRVTLAELVMVYLLGVVVVALRSKLSASIFAALLATLVFDLFFIPPFMAFTPLDPRHIVTLAVMLVVAVVISGLADLARRQASAAHRARGEAETERLRNALLSSISHDLKTPLTAITGAATTMLEDEALDGATRRDLTQTIYEEADHLNRLVSNLLYMTRLESGVVRVRKEWQPLEDVIDTAMSRLDSRLHGRELIMHFPDSVPSAPFDAVLIEQVLVNLIENAIRYTAASTPIEISATDTPSCAMLEVADRGAGVPESERSRIFDKFYRSDPRRADGGVGLGLTISNAIVRAHGGKLWVEGREGGGARFRFTLPHDEADTSSHPLPELPESGATELAT